MTHSLMHTKLVLASRSPRRISLLENLGLNFTVMPADIDETLVPGLFPGAQAQDLSLRKARHILPNCPDAWVIAADTLVVLDKRILGKPADMPEAIAMLSALSGRVHSVFTGFTVAHQELGQEYTRTVETRVWFKPLSREEILWYAGTGEPFDKAGGYGIQDKGACLVREISGSYSNVVGLPVCELVSTLISLNVIHFEEAP